MKEQLRGSSPGVSTIEILIALGVFSMCFSVLLVLVYGGEQAAFDSEMALGALQKAGEEIKRAQEIGEYSFEDLISEEGVADEGYIKKLDVKDIDSYTKEIVSHVSWLNDTMNPRSVEIRSIVVNKQEIAEGNYCSMPVDTTSWKNPHIRSLLSFGTSSKATDIDVRKGFAYVTSNATTTASYDFYVLNVFDLYNPIIVSKIHTGPGLASVVVRGNKAYVANQSLTAQLQVIDISDPFAPVVLQSISLPGIVGTGAAGIGLSISYASNRIYIGTTKASGPEFHIFDLDQEGSVTWKGSYEVGAGVNASYIQNGYAYLATPLGAELVVMDVRDPVHPVFSGQFDAPLGSGNGKSIVGSANEVHIGRTLGSNEMYVLNVTDPTHIEAIGTANTNTSINDLRIRSPLSFFATINGSKELQIWNRSLQNMFSLWSGIDLTARATALDCWRDEIYVTTEGLDTLFIIAPTS